MGTFHMKSTNFVLENVKCVHDSIKPPVWSPASSPNLAESSLAAVSDFASALPSTLRARYARPHSPPAILTGFRQIRQLAADQTCWLNLIMKCYGGSSSL